MRRFLSLLMLALPAIAAGQEHAVKTRLTLELELAKAKRVKVASPPETAAHATWDAAWAECAATGKPCLVVVRIDCTGICNGLRPDFSTAHLRDFEQDATARAVLVIPDAAGVPRRCETWRTLPSEAIIRAAAKRWAATLRPPQTRPVASWNDAT